jgi:ribosomal subunit interface protein
MLAKFEVHAIHLQRDDKLKQYVNKKIGTLDRYLPRHTKKSAHGEVYLKEIPVKGNKHSQCEVTFFLPKQTVVAAGTASSIYAAVDLARDKMKHQLRVYKDTHASGRFRRHIVARLRRRRR